MITPREYQGIAVDAVWNYFNEHTGNPICAMPTGTGKSVVQAVFLHRVLSTFPGQRILALTHVKELIEQNANKMREFWPSAPVGIYSAALKERQTQMPIIFGGIASVKNAIDDFGHVDLVLVDECHLISPNADTVYQKVIARLRKRNPYLKVIGFTATWWRTAQGSLTDQGLFTDIAINMTDMLSFNWFIEQGYLVTLIPKQTDIKVDVTGVGINNGDYVLSALQTATEKVTYGALKEAIEYAYNRRKWLVFAAGNDNAEHCAQILNSFGIPATFVHSGLSNDERDERIADFRAGKYQAITNNNILTTGFDDPDIDCIIMLRKTMSPGLWVQMLGRGTRPVFMPGYDLTSQQGRLLSIAASPKQNCLVLDFARNTRDLGPINDPVIPKAKKGGGTGDAPIKICPKCGVYNHTMVKFCVHCGNEFEFAVGFYKTAGEDILIRSEAPVFEWFNVTTVIFNKHVAKGTGKPTLKVTYVCKEDDGVKTKFFYDWIGFEHSGFMLHKAHDWWRARYHTTPPTTVDEALAIAQRGLLKRTRKIRVWTNKKYPDIVSYEYAE